MNLNYNRRIQNIIQNGVSAFNNLTQLEVLGLNNNKIKTIIQNSVSAFVALVRLKRLYLNGNLISVIIDAFNDLINLVVLNISYNCIYDIASYVYLLNIQNLHNTTVTIAPQNPIVGA